MATNQRSVAPESACSAPRRQRKPFCQRVALREPPPPPPPARERARHGAQGAWCGCARFMRTDRRRPRGSSARPRRGAPRRARSAQISAWARPPLLPALCPPPTGRTAQRQRNTGVARTLHGGRGALRAARGNRVPTRQAAEKQNPTGNACAAAPRSLKTLARAGSRRAASGRSLKP